MELLQVENLCAGYGGRRIVEAVSFSVKAGETAGIFGENGCGKTTLLKGISGLGTRLSGNVYVNGRSILSMRARERAGCISMLFSGTGMPEGLLAEEVLEMGWYGKLRFLQQPGDNLRREKEKIIRQLQMESFISEHFDRLSQGQKQLVLLGRIFLQDTPAVLMDEPDSSLDFKHKHELLRKIRAMAKEKGKACIMVLHDPGLALTYCDRVFLMKNGSITGAICPEEETPLQITEKMKEIIGNVQVTKQREAVIISP